MLKPAPAKRVYLDYAAATPVDARVLDAMQPYWSVVFGNAGSLHQEGVYAKEAVERARSLVADVVHAHADEVIFTSGGTEGNTLAMVGAVRACMEVRGAAFGDITVASTPIEHRSVTDTLAHLARSGAGVHILAVDSIGKVLVPEMVNSMPRTTALVSVIGASNELGTLQPIREIAACLRRYRDQHGHAPLLHVDASQLPAWAPIDMRSLGADLLTLDAQKVYGPKGVGCVVRSRSVPLVPVLFGGTQEYGLRPGTPPTPLIVGFAEALRLAEEERESYVQAIEALRDSFIHAVRDADIGAVLNSSQGRDCLPNIVNVSFPGLEGERVVIELDAAGVACSTRSACMANEDGGSYVVRAVTKSEERARSAVRFSFGRSSTKEDTEYAAAELISIVRRLYAEGK